MGKLILLLVMCMIDANSAHSQGVPEEYSINIRIADSLYQKRNFISAGRYYHRAFSNKQAFSMDYHRLLSAHAWQMAGFIDTALTDLYILVYALHFSQPEEITRKFSNTTLDHTIAFKQIMKQVKCNESIKQLKMVESAARVLDSIYLIDQQSRSMSGVQATSKHITASWNSQKLNEQVIDSLYGKYGWLSYSQAGHNGSMAQFLVIQHSNLQTQLKWLPTIRKAVADCKLAPENLALLIDRIKVTRKQKQIYGTQLYFDAKKRKYVPFAIDRASTVNDRRRKLGMISLEQSLLQSN